MMNVCGVKTKGCLFPETSSAFLSSHLSEHFTWISHGLLLPKLFVFQPGNSYLPTCIVQVFGLKMMETNPTQNGLRKKSVCVCVYVLVYVN